VLLPDIDFHPKDFYKKIENKLAWAKEAKQFAARIISQGCLVRLFLVALGFLPARMCESISDSPNRRLSSCERRCWRFYAKFRIIVALKVAGSILRPCCSIRSSRWWAGRTPTGRCMSSSASIASLSTPPSPRIALCAVLHGLAAHPARRRSRRIGERLSAPRVDARRAPATEGLRAIAVDGKTLRGSFDAFCDRKAAHMMTALRHADQIVLAHVMVAEKSNEIPTAPELIEALGVKDRLFTLDAEHCQKNRSRA